MQEGIITSMAEAGSSPISTSGSTSGISWPGKDPNLSIDFGQVNGSYDYGKTIGWKIKEGRDFSEEFKTDTASIILNQAAVDYMGLKKPIGETIQWFDQKFTVIGVIEDMIMGSPYETVKPIVYTLSRGANYVIMKINPQISAKAALSKIEPIFKKFNPDQPFDYQFVDNDFAQNFGNEERVGKLSGFFALLAIVISCLGLFGLTAFVAEQRQKEIGVRKVLGASVLSVWNLITKDFATLILISFLIAVPVGCFFMHNWLQHYSYRTNVSWWIPVFACAITLLIALITISFQSVKAAVANPVKSLRTE
jgi:ABC-type antimicrobial peptide transport system permease subunit